MDASLETPVNLNSLVSFHKCLCQTDESFIEQKLAVKICKNVIDSL